MIACRSCGASNPDGSEFCNKCGTRLSISPQVKQPLRWVCQNCGASNPEYASFCLNCAKAPSSPQKTEPSRYCAWCGAAVGSADRLCARCGRDPSGPESRDIEPSLRTAKPEIAGVLLVGSGLMDMASGILLFTTNGNLPDVPVDFTGMLITCGFLAFLFGVIAILGSWLSVTRRSFAMSMTAAALGMIGIGPFYSGALLGFVALIILALSREEFPD